MRCNFLSRMTTSAALGRLVHDSQNCVARGNPGADDWISRPARSRHRRDLKAACVTRESASKTPNRLLANLEATNHVKIAP